MMRPIRYKEAPKAKAAKGAKPAKAGTTSQRAGGKPAAGAAKKWYEQTWGVVLIILLIVGGIVGTFAILIATGVVPNPFSVAPTPEPEPEPTAYSIKVWDGAINKELDSGSFSYDLYGTNTSDWSDFDLLESGTDIGDISNGDLTDPSTDDHYTTFWVQFDGVQPHDDDIYGSDNDRGARTYGERWATIAPNQANNLITYETPNFVGAVIIETTSTSVITTLGAGELLVGDNVTFVFWLDSAQPEAMYVPYFDPSIEDTVEINMIVTMDGEILKGEFKVAGNSGDLTDMGAFDILTFNFGAMMPGQTLLSGTWVGPTLDPSSTTTEIDKVELFFGATSLVAIT